MRIAYDYQAFALQSYGGISRYFFHLAKNLADFNQVLRIFAPIYRNQYLSEAPGNFVDGRFMKNFPFKSYPLVKSLDFFWSRDRISQWQPSLLHETYYSNLSLAPKKCPTVITVYDMNHEIFHEQYSVFNRTSRNKRIAINRADHVICISENTKRDLMSIFDTDERKISVIHLGFDSAQKNLPDDLTPICKKPFLLFVGHRPGYKNFSSFLKAVANSKRLIKDFDLIAFGGGKFTMHELELIKSLGYADNQVRQISGSDSYLNQGYQQATAFVHPSVYEGFGIPPLEAMAQKCPVISSNSSSMPEVIGRAAEFFSPTNLEEMQFAIENVVYSKERTQELIINGLSRIQDFSWQKCAKETLSVYNSILGNVR